MGVPSTKPSHKVFRKYLERMGKKDTAVAIWEPSGSFSLISANDFFLHLFGAESPKDLIGKEPWQLSANFQPNFGMKAFDADLIIRSLFQERGNFKFRWVFQTINEEQFLSSVEISFITYGGRLYSQALIQKVTQDSTAWPPNNSFVFSRQSLFNYFPNETKNFDNFLSNSNQKSKKQFVISQIESQNSTEERHFESQARNYCSKILNLSKNSKKFTKFKKLCNELEGCFQQVFSFYNQTKIHLTIQKIKRDNFFANQKKSLSKILEKRQNILQQENKQVETLTQKNNQLFLQIEKAKSILQQNELEKNKKI
ncbi:hypothetical protein M0811_03416 [Anaeramoeba ignava]|uniref:PAS domain-containing protein n=1 Tax=Anaeramoeba ignava TaxID=1746090 RepID=A0A9Q0L6P0_ANAIG|nr:hypothetical protein M0811_03416 [Anaeramoeba ignava]